MALFIFEANRFYFHNSPTVFSFAMREYSTRPTRWLRDVMEWVAELLLVVGLCYLWFEMYSDGDVSNLGCKTYTQSNGHISNNPRDQIHIH